jgi:hypothetical protein
MRNRIAVGDTVAFPVDGIYVTGRVTRLLPAGWLVKTVEGRLSRQVAVFPMRTPEEAAALIHWISA